MSIRLDDEFLDACRQAGDPDADRLVSLLFDRLSEAEAASNSDSSTDGRPPARRLLSGLIEQDAVPSWAFPAPLKAFLDAVPERRIADPRDVLVGQRIFGSHGPEIMMALGCYSLPAAYAANDGVRVLAQTAFLESHPLRRLVETAQMVVNVMRIGGLDADGEGVRTVRKVRLMHAAIRHLLLAREPSWDIASLGMPISQEDLAGTLMTFAYLPLEVLRRLGCNLTTAEEDSFVATWAGVGRVIGVRDELIPENVADAERLTRRIQQRTIHTCLPNPDGRMLASALLEMMEGEVPVRILRFGPASLMRAFLPRDVSSALGIPRHPVGDPLVRSAMHLAAWVRGHAPATWLRHRVFRSASLTFIQAMLDFERGGKRTEFDVPRSLRGTWQLR